MAEYCNGFVMLDPNEDKFIMQQGSDDFRSWSGLRGPYYTPHVDIETGTLWFSNDAGLPNPDPVRIVGQDGRGIQLAGYASSVEDLPEEASHGDCWAVGEEDPLEAYAWFDGWCDLGELFPRGQDGTDGVSPEVTITAITGGTQIKITDKDHPAGQTFDVMNGQNGRDGTDGEDGVSPEVTMTEITGGTRLTITDADHPSGQSSDIMNGQNGRDGTDGEDGVSPEVTMTEIPGGTRLTITDADHPSGQSSDIMNGAAGPGVPSGGSAGQFYRKASATDYDGEWHTLSAGDSSYDSSLTYSSGTVGLELNSQRNTLIQICPIGAIEMFAGAVAPPKWLLCNGSAISRTTYSALFAVIGTTYGTGDGSTTFNVPNLQDRVPIGASASKALASTGGSETISYTPTGSATNTTLSGPQSGIRSHSHTYRNWLGLVQAGGGSYTVPLVDGDDSRYSTNSVDDSNATAAHSHGFSGTTATLNVMQPYMAINYIIYAGA